MNVGDRSRCLICGAMIVIIDHHISLNTGLWIHEGAVRRFFANHPAEGPKS